MPRPRRSRLMFPVNVAVCPGPRTPLVTGPDGSASNRAPALVPSGRRVTLGLEPASTALPAKLKRCSGCVWPASGGAISARVSARAHRAGVALADPPRFRLSERVRWNKGNLRNGGSRSDEGDSGGRPGLRPILMPPLGADPSSNRLPQGRHGSASSPPRLIPTGPSRPHFRRQRSRDRGAQSTRRFRGHRRRSETPPGRPIRQRTGGSVRQPWASRSSETLDEPLRSRRFFLGPEPEGDVPQRSR